MFLRLIPSAIALVVAALSFSNVASLSTLGEQNLMHPLSLQSISHNSDMSLIQSFTVGASNAKIKTYVDIYQSKFTASSLAKRDSLPDPKPEGKPEIPGITKPLDLTPAECNSLVCYSGSFEPPLKTDCDVLVDAQLYHSIGSLRAKPGYVVLVHAGTCVVVFQYPIGKLDNNLTLEYNWAMLGKIILDTQKKCNKPDDLSIGGACKINKYLKYNFQNLVISVQRYVEPSSSASNS